MLWDRISQKKITYMYKYTYLEYFGLTLLGIRSLCAHMHTLLDCCAGNFKCLKATAVVMADELALTSSLLVSY